MDAPAWLTASRADVPDGEAWLGARERAVLARLRFARRREDWRLGRWAAKAAAGAWLGVAPAAVEVLAAADGAPEAWLGAERAPVSLSISHREGRALAAVGAPAAAVGCDLEALEPRSDAFVRSWLAAEEQALVAAARPGAARDRLANLVWTAKEAAAKTRREGLRLEVARAVVRLGDDGGAAGGWTRMRVQWGDGVPATAGWWREEPGWVMALAALGRYGSTSPRRIA